MKVSIFIPTGNRAKSLDRELASLTKQTYKNFEILIVDYKSTDETPSVIEKFSKKLNIKHIHQKDKGLSRAANLALDKATGQIFIRTDDDVVMSPKWLDSLHKSFVSDKSVGGVTGPTVITESFKKNRDLFVFENKFRTGNALWRMIGNIYTGYFMEGNPNRVSHWFDCGAFSLGTNFESARGEPVQEVTNLEACNFAVRTNLLRKIGGFDTSYTGLGEYHEPDAALKIRALGYRLVFNPKAYLNHYPSQDGFFKERPESYSRMVNFIIFYLRNLKPDSFRKLTRFAAYVLFLNAYYVFVGIKTKQPSQLGAIPGTFVGIIKHSTGT